MTSIFDDNRRQIPVTLIEAGPCVVTQVKTEESDGYNAVQLGFGDKKEKNTSKPLVGHFAKAGTSPKAQVLEFDFNPADYKLGDEITVELFEEGDFIDVIGTSKGKGFQGVVKRHGFAGVGGRTHGQHNRERAPGSLGAGSYPSRVFKGTRMGGQMGNKQITVQNLRIVKVIADKNLLVVSGSVPGARGSVVQVWK